MLYNVLRYRSWLYLIPLAESLKGLKLLTTTSLAPVHPGEILLEDFLEPLGLSQNQAARAMMVPPRRINEIVHGKRGITADTAARLSRYFGTSAEFWLNLQARYELDQLEETQAESLAAIVPLASAASSTIRTPLPSPRRKGAASLLLAVPAVETS